MLKKSTRWCDGGGYQTSIKAVSLRISLRSFGRSAAAYLALFVVDFNYSFMGLG